MAKEYASALIMEKNQTKVLTNRTWKFQKKQIPSPIMEPRHCKRTRTKDKDEGKMILSHINFLSPTFVVKVKDKVEGPTIKTPNVSALGVTH